MSQHLLIPDNLNSFMAVLCQFMRGFHHPRLSSGRPHKLDLSFPDPPFATPNFDQFVDIFTVCCELLALPSSLAKMIGGEIGHGRRRLPIRIEVDVLCCQVVLG